MQSYLSNDRARKQLEQILHPSIRTTMRLKMEKAQQQYPDKLVVVDVPLLYESELESMFDEVLVVYVPRDIQLARLIERDKLSYEQAEERLKAQMPIEQKKEQADYVIDNRGTLEETEIQVEALWKRKGFS